MQRDELVGRKMLETDIPDRKGGRIRGSLREGMTHQAGRTKG